MASTNHNARIAGFLYLLLILAARLRLLYIPNVLFVTGDAAATTRNLVAHEMLFRFGIAADLFVGAITVFLALALYRLFRKVNPHQALLMLILGLMDVPLYFFGAISDSIALLIARGNDFLGAFGPAQHDALVVLALKLHSQEIGAAQAFWGLWLIPLGLLVWRSSFLPRLLGGWLVLNGVAYVAQCVLWALLPQYQDTISNVAFPIQFGEVVFMLWLLILGARPGFRHVPWLRAPAPS